MNFTWKWLTFCSHKLTLGIMDRYDVGLLQRVATVGYDIDWDDVTIVVNNSGDHTHRGRSCGQDMWSMLLLSCWCSSLLRYLGVP